MIGDMSEVVSEGLVPMWTLGDRLGKALSAADVSASEMADYLGVHRNSISSYINDRHTPKRGTLVLWAMRTGVAVQWLETGETPAGPTDPNGGGRKPDQLSRLTDQKRSRSRATDTRRYFATSACAA